MRIRILIAVLAAGLVLAACGGDGPRRDSSGQIVERGNASVFSLRVGDCFDDDLLAQDQATAVAAVPCSEPHDNEVYHIYQSTLFAFPGRDAMLEAATADCYDRFAPFVGSAYEVSELEFFPITPTADSWTDGDREVLCAVYAMDLAKLTGSMRGSGR